MPVLNKSQLSDTLKVRQAQASDHNVVEELLHQSVSLKQPGKSPLLKNLIKDGCLFLAQGNKQAEGMIALDLDRGSIALAAIRSPARAANHWPKLLQALERRAVAFGMETLQLHASSKPHPCFRFPGYRVIEGSGDNWLWERSLRRRLGVFAREARRLNAELGVPAHYGQRHRLALQAEPRQLASIGLDVFNREQYLWPQAAMAWLALQRAAAADQIEILPVSAFRSMQYQFGLVEKKVLKGLSMDEILRVSAAPGYSEHHSGRAIDVTGPGSDPLEENFAKTPAFAWLKLHARKFGFRMSYPRGNRHRVAYEPWHWYYFL